jgi:uncharacterized protein DUF1501
MEPLSRRSLLAAAAAAALMPRGVLGAGAVRAKSLLVLWLEGGPSQLETWDPHPGMAIGGLVGAVKTRVPGLEIADFYPRVAEQVHRLSVLRSVVSKEGDHERGTYAVKTGHRPEGATIHPSLGAIACHEVPVVERGLPPHVSLGKSQWPARGGFLGAGLDAFRIVTPGTLENLEPPAKVRAREERRLEALRVVEAGFSAAPARHREALDGALAMMSSPKARAFVLDDEPRAVRAAYGDHPFGRGCLVARRLLEAGVRAVEVTLSGFDSHAGNHEAHRTAAQVLDPALSTLLAELAERDLLRSTVVLVTGEFGRTPKINVAGGRDHWPTGFSCLLGGGGIAGGQVIGQTDPAGAKADPAAAVPVGDVAATVLAALGVDVRVELETPEGRPIPVTTGKPIRRLL